MVSMVKYCVWTKKFLELAEQPSCKAGLLFEMRVVEAPLVCEEWVQMLCEGRW